LDFLKRLDLDQIMGRDHGESDSIYRCERDDSPYPLWRRILLENATKFRKVLPAQPVDATPANRLIGQHFSQGTDLSELYSIKPRQDSVFRLYQSPSSDVALEALLTRF
jgi:hypothetical protein